MSECYICYGEDATLQCVYCDRPKVCLQCIQNDCVSNARKATCFGCSKEYDLFTLIKQLPLDWIQGFYIAHISELLLKEERTILPTYMDKAGRVVDSQQYQHIFDCIIQRINNIKLEWSKLRTSNHILGAYTVHEYAEVPYDQPMLSQKDIMDLGYNRYYEYELNFLSAKIRNLQKPIRTLADVETLVQINGREKKKDTRNVRCAGSECEGYVNSDNICPLCKVKTCPCCLELMEDEHKCDPDILKSVKAMIKDSKPCPKCDISIHRTFGCSQMFCTNCQTFFNYETGAIYKHAIENPEYTDFLRRGGKNVVQSGNSRYCCRDDLPRMTKVRSEILKAQGLYQAYRTCSELIDYRGDIQHVITSLDRTRQAVSIMYLAELIDEDKWKHYLVSLNVRGFYEIQKRDLVETFRNILIYLLNAILDEDMINYAMLDKGIYETFTEAREDFNRNMAHLTNTFAYGELIYIDGLWKMCDTHIWMSDYTDIRRFYTKKNVNELKKVLKAKGLSMSSLLKPDIVIISTLLDKDKLNPLSLDADILLETKGRDALHSRIYHILCRYPDFVSGASDPISRNHRRDVLAMIKNPVHLEELMAR